MSRLSKLIPSRRWLFIPPILLGVGVVAWLASEKKELTRTELVETATPMKVIRVRRESIHPRAIGFGTTSPGRRWSAVAEVGGRLVQTHPNLRSGVPVRAGEMLVTIDRADYQLQLRQRKADLQNAVAQLEQSKLNRTADEKSLEIQQDLLKVRVQDVNRVQELRTRNAASESEVDASRAAELQQQQTVQNLVNALSTYPAKIDSAQAAIETAKARVDEAQRNLDRTVIVAPFDGLLTDVSLEPGQYVAPGQMMFEIIDTSWVEVEAQFSLAQIDKILTAGEIASEPILDDSPRSTTMEVASESAPDDLQAYPSVGPSMADEYLQAEPATDSLLDLQADLVVRSGDIRRRFSGRPVRFTSSLDEQTRTLGIVIRVDQPMVDRSNAGPATIAKNRVPTRRGGGLGVDTGRLRVGAYCEVELVGGAAIQAFSVPRTSLNDNAVYIVDTDGRLQRRTVEVVMIIDDRAVIESGLEAGQYVVINPPAVVVEGELIDPIETDGIPTALTATTAQAGAQTTARTGANHD
ncbi:MAG: HlyD family efflux transporter periplasmic adaptor subunit [Planctomycetota bacterium]